MSLTESERRAAMCEELGLTNEELSLFIGSKRRDKRERRQWRRTPGIDAAIRRGPCLIVLAVLLGVAAGCGSSYSQYTFTPDHESIHDTNPTKDVKCGEVSWEWSSGSFNQTHNYVGIGHFCPEPAGTRP